MRTILVILDGAADRPCKELGNRTPFEAAYKPNLDKLAREGKCGMLYTVGKNIAPESDVAVTALLGYDPYKYFTGRGPLEAFGAGMKLGRNFLALRTNFATMKGDEITDRRVGRSLTTKEAHQLAEAINREVKLPCKFNFKSTTEHRGVLVLYGKFSEKVSNSDPAYSKSGNFGIAKANASSKILETMALAKNAKRTAEIINEFVRQSRAILESHPVNAKRDKNKLPAANAILPRDAGNKLPSFKKKKKWSAVVGMPLEIGLARLAGMEIIKVNYPLISGRDVYKHLYASLKAEIKTALRHLKSRRNLYIHFKETDIPGHDGFPIEKKKMIEMIDKKFFSKALRLNDTKLIVTCDHSTPCALKAHSAEPVPVLEHDGFSMDHVLAFTELECRKGSLGTRLGRQILENQ